MSIGKERLPYIRSCKKKRIPKRTEIANKSLCYQSTKYIKYVCKFSGKPRNSDLKRKRTTKSFRSNCPFALELVLSQNNQELEVVKFVEEHNHIMNEHIYGHLPRRRALPEDLALEVKESITLKANKKFLQQKVQTATGKKVTLKDLSNLRQKTNQGISKNDISDIVAYLNQKEGCTVDLMIDSENNFKVNFYQGQYMKKMYERYPEILLVDATYKLLECI